MNITPLILTFNEAPNIRRVLEKLAWAKDIVVVDSFSTDETLDIVESFPQARVVQRKFDTFAQQCNFGLEQISTEWVLSLDADYVLSDALVRELGSLSPPDEVAGYRANFKYCVDGRPLRASLYPPRTVLYRRDRARYENEGHGHRVRVEGDLARLRATIDHDDRKPLGRWLNEQNKYMVIECRELRAKRPTDMSLQDRMRRRIVFAPALVFLYTLIVKGLIFDGRRGWIYVCQRTMAELILSLRLAEARLRSPE